MRYGADVSPTYRLFRSLIAFLVGLGALVWSAGVPVLFIEPETSALSFSVALIALLGGVRLSVLITGAYVGLVLTGQVPWEGIDPQGLELPTDQQLGYLVGLVPGALFAGALSRRNHWLRLFVAAFVGHAAIFATGAAVLGQHLGLTYALVAGVWPYVAGAVVKSALVATLVAIFRPPVDA